MGEDMDVDGKKRRKRRTITVSDAAYELIASIVGKGKQFKTLTEAATGIISDTASAVLVERQAREKADMTIIDLEAEVERFTMRQKALIEEGRVARGQASDWENKYNTGKTIVILISVVYVVVTTISYLLLR